MHFFENAIPLYLVATATTCTTTPHHPLLCLIAHIPDLEKGFDGLIYATRQVAIRVANNAVIGIINHWRKQT